MLLDHGANIHDDDVSSAASVYLITRSMRALSIAIRSG